ncbi:hypothetical protein RFI_13044 [Reticulomyxa filosa]|uniref:Uncharacterized protein n=1 Tax=Reticulomyxa filosa TaxID=46433 RepID=X6NDN7_RETFI|nr:hypothetical protein RFI_13044 [Reticulomyxa filosa]|eukprot:ETO24116.1 hypothetical protein RFI_13044 [Reticulomyxa filosa]
MYRTELDGEPSYAKTIAHDRTLISEVKHGISMKYGETWIRAQFQDHTEHIAKMALGEEVFRDDNLEFRFVRVSCFMLCLIQICQYVNNNNRKEDWQANEWRVNQWKKTTSFADALQVLTINRKNNKKSIAIHSFVVTKNTCVNLNIRNKKNVP